MTRLKKESVVAAVVIAALAALVAIKRLAPAGSTPWPVQNVTQAERRTAVFGDGRIPAARLAEALGREVADFARAGEASADAAGRVEQLVQERPNYVIVSLGAADLEQSLPLERSIASLEAVFAALQRAGALVIFAPPAPPADVGDNWLLAIEDVARRAGVAWVRPSQAADAGAAAAAALREYD